MHFYLKYRNAQLYFVFHSAAAYFANLPLFANFATINIDRYEHHIRYGRQDLPRP